MKRISVLLLIMISLLATLFAGTGRIPGVSALTVTDVTLSTRQAGAVSSYTIAGTIKCRASVVDSYGRCYLSDRNNRSDGCPVSKLGHS